MRNRRLQSSFKTALSLQPSLEEAVKEVAEILSGTSLVDLALVFVSTDFASDLPRLMPLLQNHLEAKCWVGCVGEGVIGTDSKGVVCEVEKRPSLSISLVSLPEAVLQPFCFDPRALPDLDSSAQQWQPRRRPVEREPTLDGAEDKANRTRESSAGRLDTGAAGNL